MSHYKPAYDTKTLRNHRVFVSNLSKNADDFALKEFIQSKLNIQKPSDLYCLNLGIGSFGKKEKLGVGIIDFSKKHYLETCIINSGQWEYLGKYLEFESDQNCEKLTKYVEGLNRGFHLEFNAYGTPRVYERSYKKKDSFVQIEGRGEEEYVYDDYKSRKRRMNDLDEVRKEEKRVQKGKNHSHNEAIDLTHVKEDPYFQVSSVLIQQLLGHQAFDADGLPLIDDLTDLRQTCLHFEGFYHTSNKDQLSESDVFEIFSSLGEVRSVDLYSKVPKYDKNSGKSYYTGLIEFCRSRDAKRALLVNQCDSSVTYKGKRYENLRLSMSQEMRKFPDGLGNLEVPIPETEAVNRCLQEYNIDPYKEYGIAMEFRPMVYDTDLIIKIIKLVAEIMKKPEAQKSYRGKTPYLFTTKTGYDAMQLIHVFNDCELHWKDSRGERIISKMRCKLDYKYVASANEMKQEHPVGLPRKDVLPPSGPPSGPVLGIPPPRMDLHDSKLLEDSKKLKITVRNNVRKEKDRELDNERKRQRKSNDELNRKRKKDDVDDKEDVEKLAKKLGISKKMVNALRVISQEDKKSDSDESEEVEIVGETKPVPKNPETVPTWQNMSQISTSKAPGQSANRTWADNYQDQLRQGQTAQNQQNLMTNQPKGWFPPATVQYDQNLGNPYHPNGAAMTQKYNYYSNLQSQMNYQYGAPTYDAPAAVTSSSMLPQSQTQTHSYASKTYGQNPPTTMIPNEKWSADHKNSNSGHNQPLLTRKKNKGKFIPYSPDDDQPRDIKLNKYEKKRYHATSMESYQATTNDTIFLRNLPRTLTEEKLHRIMLTFGRVVFFDFPKDEKGNCLGYAYCQFDRMDAEIAVRKAISQWDGEIMENNYIEVGRY